MSICKSIIINAEPAKVRSIFFDFPGHKKWNPFFTSIETYNPKDATPEPGSQLRIELKIKGSKSSNVMYPIVLQNDEHIFKWKGKLLFEFIFVGEHSFEFKNVNGNTELIQKEKFSGIIAPLFSWLGMIESTAVSFGELNEGLKAFCEAK